MYANDEIYTSRGVNIVQYLRRWCLFVKQDSNSVIAKSLMNCDHKVAHRQSTIHDLMCFRFCQCEKLWQLLFDHCRQIIVNRAHQIFFIVCFLNYYECQKIMLHVSIGYRRLRMDYTLILKMKSKPLLVFILDPFMYDWYAITYRICQFILWNPRTIEEVMINISISNNRKNWFLFPYTQPLKNFKLIIIIYKLQKWRMLSNR